MDEETLQFFDSWLKVYYKKLFPVETFCKWLSYKCESDTLLRREFSFTLAGDIYLRYQSFKDANELRQELVKTCPHKIDIGAVYSASPKIYRSMMSSSYKPLWKELVFDIDLTDYDDIRFCCGSNSESGKAMCDLCWQLAQSAVIALDRALREDFGFSKLMWVYSGRRGVHCWVCDQAARTLDASARTAVAEYLSVVKPMTSRKTLTSNKPLHPSIEAAFEKLYPRFLRYIKTKNGQNFFAREAGVDYFLKMLPSSEMSNEIETLKREFLNDEVSNSSDDVSTKRWNTIKVFLKENKRENLMKEIVLQLTYPRLDVHVSTGVNHLLKSPFAIHPKTGFICVPFDPNTCCDFFPCNVPTISKIMKELELSANNDNTHLLPYKRTSLKPFIERFEKFVSSLESIEDDCKGPTQSQSLAF
ncbi:primase, DNA, polypeptide 1 (49kDa) [Cichlidogyrus casuarinus]|uniref:DNA primase n=1 Tax=Cichlidogyrus casuarinus TaxID=1844966 RepID=A0ABD2Q837_9PLAT